MSPSKCESPPPVAAVVGEGAPSAARGAAALPCARINGNASPAPSDAHPPGSQWGADEEAILRHCYPDHGAIGTHTELPHRSLDAIRAHAAKLGVHDIHRTWSPGEIECLKVVYPKGGAEAVHNRIPLRSVDAIRRKASELSIKHDRRSAATITVGDVTQAIAAADGSLVHAARALGCDYASLRRVATNNGLLGGDSDSKPHWKTNEVEVVRAEYRSGGAAAVRAKLPHRSTHAIYRMARRLGLTSG